MAGIVSSDFLHCLRSGVDALELWLGQSASIGAYLQPRAILQHLKIIILQDDDIVRRNEKIKLIKSHCLLDFGYEEQKPRLLSGDRPRTKGSGASL